MDWLEAAVARHHPDMEETTEVLARGLVTAIAQSRDGSTP
jgi:hypothetical protein